MAVHLPVTHLTPAPVATSVAAPRAAHSDLFGTLAPPMRGAPYGVEQSVLTPAAATSDDEHVVKLLEACRRGLAYSGEPAFVLAAETITDLAASAGLS